MEDRLIGRTQDEWASLLEEDPTNELVRFSYAKALMDEKKWSEARAQFEKLVSDQAEYALAWAFLARCCLEAGDKVEARKVCERGLPIALKQCHEIPEEEIRAVLEELDSDF